MKKYSIDGIYGRVEFDVLDKQKGFDTTYNVVEYDDETCTPVNNSEWKEFKPGLPRDITDNQYFNMALINEFKKLNKNIEHLASTIRQQNIKL